MFLLAGSALAETSEELFARGAQALGKGEYGAAIDAFEALADQGFVHPDASYDRGLAYVMRVRAHAERPGDLGRAAAAFEETLLLRPGDHDADLGLDRVRAEVTRRRSRGSKDDIDVRPTLDRLVVGLGSEQSWGLSALVASLLLAIGLVLWRRTGRAHVIGAVLAPTAAIALLLFVPLTWGARHLRLSTRPGVVVVTEVTLLNEDGTPRPKETIPEAAAVETGERRGGMIHVRWGSSEGFVPLGSVRLIGP
ncbi:MAG: hypothetical protein U0359_12460 [Byssovorax sp.]